MQYPPISSKSYKTTSYKILATFDNSPDVTANILSDWMENDGGVAGAADSADADADAEESAS